MAFQALKDSCQYVFRPIKAFNDLDIGTYRVESFSMKNTKFGKRIFVNIGDFAVVLPPRFLERINKPKQLDNLNAGSYKMVYRGKDKSRKDLLLLDFVEVDSGDDDSDDEMKASTSTHIVDGADDTSSKRTGDENDTSSKRTGDEDGNEPQTKTPRKRSPKKFF